MCNGLNQHKQGVFSPSNLHLSSSAPQLPKAYSNLGFKAYSAIRFLSSCSARLSADFGFVVLRAGIEEKRCLGPGEGHGVVAGVTANGVGGVKLGQGNPPASALEHKELTLDDELAQSMPLLTRRDDCMVDKMGRERKLFVDFVRSVQPEFRAFLAMLTSEPRPD